jgi:hypothetical protein
MILSKKYKEEINKIVMNDDMKKRILQKVLTANENSEEKNIKAQTTLPKVKKYNNLKRSVQIVAAGFTIVLCLSIAKNYPMLLKSAPNDLKQNETAKSNDDENNDLKSSDDNELVNNKDNKETSNNDHKEDQALNQNNNGDDRAKEESNTSSSKTTQKESNAGSKIGQQKNDKDKLQSTSGSEVEKSQTSQTNAGKATGNSNISSKTNPEEAAKNKENKNVTSTEEKTKHGEVMLDKTPENNTDDSVSSTSVITEEAVNYDQEYKTLDEAEKVLNLKINPLKTLPQGFKIGRISVISNEIIQVEYNDGSNNITFRAGKGIDNISGDYNVYQVKNTVKVNGINVNLEGNKSEEYNLAAWEKDGISYSISLENGIDEKTILDMIS